MLPNGYQSPSRKQIAENLLDSVYDQLQGGMKELIDGKTGTLVQDGWSNIHNEPIITSHPIGQSSHWIHGENQREL